MSSFLYGLGRAAYRRRIAVLLAWLGVLVVLGGLAGTFGGKLDESFSLPGTESQAALDSLSRTFPQASGTSAQVVVVAPDGTTVRSPVVRERIADAVKQYEAIGQVDGAISPYDTFAKGLISDDESAAIISVRLDADLGNITPETFDALGETTQALQQSIPGSQAAIGGEAYNDSRPSLSIVEAVGVLVALVVLFLTLGSFRAAGMPILTALLGVGLTMALIFFATRFTVISSSTPLLALMLGLAVGIDYALFIVSRHRDQLAAGMEPEESVARSVATAGSAVVFAGLTVMIALSGLAVAGIPFLTTMGVAAAVGVAIAVCIALTLLPALLGFAGERLRPRQRRSRRPDARPRPERVGMARRWVRLVTRVPIVTIVLVVAALGAMAIPAKDLRIALPSNGVSDPGTPARVTYDLTTDHFGLGYNGPLIVSATIIGSDDPLKLMDDVADDLRALPGVASVPLSTPNQDASVGIVQVIPENAPDSTETKDLVLTIRSMKQYFEDTYDIPIYVTGHTAVGIDVSDRLGRALIPFGVLVVGLSLVLLAMVFRSIAVPIKATVGYLLSVGAAFGATAMVFEYGWFGSIFNVHQTAPVISFLPILLMGILFGLAMDYEVFLVSRIREEYVHSSDVSDADGTRSRAAIEKGFVASSRVVVAAAIIMFAVFAAFVPEGDGAIKTIAFGLAVGVFIDAFVVRITLVPAVLALLGRTAWWFPTWLNRRLPSFDVEGEALAHQLALAEWPAPGDDHLLYAENVPTSTGPVTVAARAGEVVVVDGGSAADRTGLLLAVSGRAKLGSHPFPAKVAGLVLPQQASAARARTAYVDCTEVLDPRRELRAAGKRRAAAILVAGAERLVDPVEREELRALAARVVAPDSTTCLIVAVSEGSAIADLLPAHTRLLSLTGSDRLVAAQVA